VAASVQWLNCIHTATDHCGIARSRYSQCIHYTVHVAYGVNKQAMKCNTHCAWQVAAEQRNSSQYSTTLRAVAVEHRRSCNSPPDSRRNTKGAISPICISKHVCVCVNVFEKQRNLLQALFSWSLVGFDYTFRKQRTTETGNTGNTHMFANESRALNLPHKTPFTTLNLFMYMETVEPKPVWTKAYVRNKQYIALDSTVFT